MLKRGGLRRECFVSGTSSGNGMWDTGGSLESDSWNDTLFAVAAAESFTVVKAEEAGA